ncbi:MAG TPA: hypothetical protein VGN26_04125 [Armatimonadota bacterium]|jgi:hypothetical protein
MKRTRQYGRARWGKPNPLTKKAIREHNKALDYENGWIEPTSADRDAAREQPETEVTP